MIGTKYTTLLLSKCFPSMYPEELRGMTDFHRLFRTNLLGNGNGLSTTTNELVIMRHVYVFNIALPN